MLEDFDIIEEELEFVAQLNSMNALFWASKSQLLFTPIIKIGRAKIFNITLCLTERRKLHTPRMALG